MHAGVRARLLVLLDDVLPRHGDDELLAAFGAAARLA